MLTRGTKVDAFECALAERCEARYAVAFNSGSSALAAAYHVIGFSSRDHVITTPNTFIATLAPALQKRAHFSFLDIDQN